jgi:diguanylate cyclase (GGDEF)-like protein/PAS domain S-box-containing protein
MIVHKSRLTADVLEGIVTNLLDRHSDAPVAALGPDGWIIPLPDAFPVNGHPVLTTETALDLVVVADRPTVVSAWARARATGAAQGVVHLLDEPERETLMQFADLRDRYGVYVLLMIRGGVATRQRSDDDDSVLRPRYCQIRRSELAYVSEVDDASVRLFGWSAESMIGRRSIELIHPDDRDRAIDNWLEMLGRPGQAARWRGRYLNADGTWTWLEITNYNRLADPEHADVLTEMVNIDDEMAMHETLRASEELIRELTNALPVGVLQIDRDGSVVFANPGAREIFANRKLTTLESMRVQIVDDDRDALDNAFEAVLQHGEAGDIEIRLQSMCGVTNRSCQMNVRPLGESSGIVIGAIACVSDVTESVRLRDELQVRATHDDLTGCLNRASTLRHLELLLQTNDDVAVIFIDLDAFKPVNDHHGHAVGDELLKVVADRLRSSVRQGDVVGRMGGDEFVVLHSGISELDQLAELATRVQRTLHMEAGLAGVVVPVRASVGATHSSGRLDAELVLAEADSAMYTAKRTLASEPVLYDGVPGVASNGQGQPGPVRPTCRFAP